MEKCQFINRGNLTMMILVKYNTNWADEIEAEGFKLFESMESFDKAFKDRFGISYNSDLFDIDEDYFGSAYYFVKHLVNNVSDLNSSIKEIFCNTYSDEEEWEEVVKVFEAIGEMENLSMDGEYLCHLEKVLKKLYDDMNETICVSIGTNQWVEHRCVKDFLEENLTVFEISNEESEFVKRVFGEEGGVFPF